MRWSLDHKTSSTGLTRQLRNLCDPKGGLKGPPPPNSHSPFCGREHGHAQGDEGDVYPRHAMDFDPTRRIRAVGPAAAVCSPVRQIPPDPPIPFSRASRAPRRVAPERDHSRKGASPNLAYPVPRSPDAPLASFAARKMLQQEELSRRHPNPARVCSWIRGGGGGGGGNIAQVGRKWSSSEEDRNGHFRTGSQSPWAAGIGYKFLIFE